MCADDSGGRADGRQPLRWFCRSPATVEYHGAYRAPCDDVFGRPLAPTVTDEVYHHRREIFQQVSEGLHHRRQYSQPSFNALFSRGVLQLNIARAIDPHVVQDSIESNLMPVERLRSPLEERNRCRFRFHSLALLVCRGMLRYDYEIPLTVSCSPLENPELMRRGGVRGKKLPWQFIQMYIQAFNQLTIAEEYRTVLRFGRPLGISKNSKARVQESWTTRLDFGLVRSPLLHCRRLRLHLENPERKFPNQTFLAEIKRFFHMDDISFGADTFKEAKVRIKTVVNVFRDDWFPLAK